MLPEFHPDIRESMDGGVSQYRYRNQLQRLDALQHLNRRHGDFTTGNDGCRKGTSVQLVAVLLMVVHGSGYLLLLRSALHGIDIWRLRVLPCTRAMSPPLFLYPALFIYHHGITLCVDSSG